MTHNSLSLLGICISAHCSPTFIQVFWLISKAIFQNGKENMILETPYKTLVNFWGFFSIKNYVTLT